MLLYVKAHTEKATVTEDWATELPTIAFRLAWLGKEADIAD